MKYYINGTDIITFEKEGYTEIESPIQENGKIFKKHKNLNQLPRDSDGNFYEFYKKVGEEYLPDFQKMEEELAKSMALDFKRDQVNAIETATVVISTGKEFDANLEARVNMSTAIQSAIDNNILKTIWRLTDNSEVEITIEELKEANYLALSKFAEIKKIGS